MDETTWIQNQRKQWFLSWLSWRKCSDLPEKIMVSSWFNRLKSSKISWKTIKSARNWNQKSTSNGNLEPWTKGPHTWSTDFWIVRRHETWGLNQPRLKVLNIQKLTQKEDSTNKEKVLACFDIINLMCTSTLKPTNQPEMTGPESGSTEDWCCPLESSPFCGPKSWTILYYVDP